MRKKVWLIAIPVGVILIGLILTAVLLSGRHKVTVGICYRQENSGNTAFQTELVERLKGQGVQVVTMDANGDQARQMEQIAQLGREKCDLIIVEPVMETAGEDLLALLQSTEVPAILFNREISGELLQQYPSVSVISSDSDRAGQQMAQAICAIPQGGDINGDGITAYTVIQGPENHKTAICQTRAMEQGFGEMQVQCLSLEYGDWSLVSGRQLCKQQLSLLGPDIEVIVCGNGQMALGAAEAVESGGRMPQQDIYLLCYDDLGESAILLEQGKVNGVVSQDWEAVLNAICQTAAQKLAGEQGIQKQNVDYKIITAENR